MEGIQAALRILPQELDRTDGTEGVDAALDVLRKLPMTKDESLKNARRTRARLAKGRDSPNVKKKQSVSGKIKTVRLPVSEYK